jgi:hypothetical protein
MAGERFHSGRNGVTYDHNGSSVIGGKTTHKVGFYGNLGATQTAFTVTNHTDDRALNESADTLAQVANVLGTLINDLKAKGLFG